jgi:HD superfamily phosphodiesterase
VIAVNSYAERVSVLARPLYHELPYHNWGHAMLVCARASELAKRVIASGREVDLDVVAAAAYCHDIAWALDPTTLRGREKMPNRESLAAAFAASILSRLGAHDDFIGRVCGAILATVVGAEMRTLEEMILRAADLAGIAMPYDRYSLEGRMLEEEQAILRGDGSTNSAVFARGTALLLGEYTWPRIQLTEHYFDVDGASRFHRRALGNILRGVREKMGSGIEVVGEFECGKTPSMLSSGHDLEGTVFVGWDTVQTNLRHALALARAKANGGPRPVMLAMPSERRAISLPNGVLDVLYVSDHLADVLRGFPMVEFTRVLKRGGRLSLTEASGGNRWLGHNEGRIRDRAKEAFMGAGLGFVGLTKGDESWTMVFEK